MQTEKDGSISVVLDPYIPADMNYARGSIKTYWGDIVLGWSREVNGVSYTVSLPGAVHAVMKRNGEEICLNGGVYRVHKCADPFL